MMQPRCSCPGNQFPGEPEWVEDSRYAFLPDTTGTSMSKTPRIPIPPAVRKYVFERDSYHCQSCGQTHGEADLTIDHIIALAAGGSNDLSNLQTLCCRCNQQKKHHFDPRFRRRYS
jgi:5-methylcytosine-specific restriction endonuclease McrA